MTVLAEGNLQLTLPDNVNGRKFDDAAHGLTHCMKAVDFIVELPERLLFIEFKDPEHPSAPRESRDRFVKTFLAGQLDAELTYKYRDSFLYQWASGNLKKPVYYLVLVALSRLTDAELLTRTEALKRQLPLEGPASGIWHRPIVAGCSVFNIETWNKNLSQYPVSRASP